jgi:hypothetical protein
MVEAARESLVIGQRKARNAAYARWCIAKQFGYARVSSDDQDTAGKTNEILDCSAVAFTTVLFTIPAWAQATDQNINERAGVIAWILVGLMHEHTGEGRAAPP